MDTKSGHADDDEDAREADQLGRDEEFCARLIEEIDDTNAILEQMRRRPGFRARIARLLHPRPPERLTAEPPPPRDG